jgi:GT2 family glycosyltransferase
MPTTQLTCAISIATHNRLPELRRTLSVIAALDPPPSHLLICADGCTDGTSAYIRENFPQALVIEHDAPRGSIPSRIELMRAATSDIVISLDDDSHPTNGSFIGQVRELFAENPHVAVASFTQRTDEFPATLHQDSFGPSHYAATYINAAAAFRRSVYMKLEGWPADFQHAYDEPDYTLQCLAAGYAVFHHTGIIIRHHFTATGRNEIRTHHRHARNEQWAAWRRCPFPAVLALSAYRALSQLNYARKRGPAWLIREPLWWLQAFRGLSASLQKRRPIPWRVYGRWLCLMRHPIESFDEWRRLFPEAS